MNRIHPFHIRSTKAREPLLVRKTIQCGVVHLTQIKRDLLMQEYANLQHFLQTGIDLGVYSSHKQQATRFYKRIKRDKEYPLSIRKDLLKIERQPTKLAKYWARIPVKGRRGGVWVAIKPHTEFPDEFELCESKLLKKQGKFLLHVTIQKETDVFFPTNPAKLAVIAIDIGEANPISSVVWWNRKVQAIHFKAPEVRKIRSHYNHVKKEIGRKKIKHALRIIKKLGHKEHRKVRDQLHKATRELVKQAIKLRKRGYHPVIAVGDLKGVRSPRKKGLPRCRQTNRKIHSMPSYQIKFQLEYKALWAGIPVLFVNEAYTSQRCYQCGTKGVRRKRQFRCACGLDYNADLNGAQNILHRSLGYMLRDRAVVDWPRSPTVNPEQRVCQRAMGEAPSQGTE